jgi:PKD repeat protein
VGGGYTWQVWGSQSAVGIVKDIQVYDASANTWTTVEGLFNRLNHNMVVSDGTLYVFNGLDPDYPANRLNIGTLSGVSAPLSATASADKTSGTAPLTVAFTGSASGGTTPYTYDWDFGDGSAHGTTASASHTFTTDGTYSVLFTVTDSASATASKTITITVTAPVTNPPVISSMKKAGSPFRFIVMGSNFQSGIQVFIGGDATPWATVTQKGTTKLVIKGGKTLKTKVPKGTPTVFTFKNTDGGSADYTFSW